MDKNWKFRVVVVLLLLPLFFLNLKNSHDWGDDFAQYLLQARNIVEGRPQTDNGLLQNADDPAYAIQAYPVGLPLIISPLYYFWKGSILPYCILNSCILFLTGLLLFEYFKKRVNAVAAIIITLLFCYSESVLDLKKQILSEIPFTCMLMLLVLWIGTTLSQKKYSWIFIGFLLAFITSIRLAGIAVVAGYILFELITIFRVVNLKERTYELKRLIFSILSAIFIFITLNGILFPINPGGLFSFYSTAFQSHEIQLMTNLKFYYTVVEYLFPFYGSWIPSVWILIALAGWSINLIKSPTLAEYIFPFYALIIIFYPYTNAGLRFIIPLLPLLIYYCYYFFNWIFSRVTVNSHIVSSAILIIALTAYTNPLRGIIKSQSAVEDGPQQKVSEELFTFLRSTPEDAVMVFCKARAISLYSNHSSLYTAKNQTNEEAFTQFHRYNLLYLIIAKVPADNEIYDPRLLDFISTYKEKYERVWENEHFNVYRQLASR
jgi:hypothetical protein